MRMPSRPDHVRKQNVRLVLSCLRENSTLSRTEIATKTQLSPASVTSITSTMCDSLLTLESEHKSTIGRGRPQVQLSLSPKIASIAAVILRHNRFEISLNDYAGNRLWHHGQMINTPYLERESFVDIVLEMIQSAKEVAEDQQFPLCAVGVAVQGVVDVSGRSILWSPITPLRDVALVNAIEERFNCSAMLANDSTMIARSLANHHADILGEDFLTLQVSRGIGMAMVREGVPVGGWRSSANEFGHMTYIENGAHCRCGQRGCIEAYSSNYAILRIADGHSEDSTPPARVDPAHLLRILETARREDGIERKAFQRAGKALGFGLRNLFALMDPMPIAMVGAGATAFDLTKDFIHEALRTSSAAIELPSITCFEDDEDLKLDGTVIAALDLLDDVFAISIAQDKPLITPIQSALNSKEMSDA